VVADFRVGRYGLQESQASGNNGMAERSYLSIVSGLPRSGTSMMMHMLADGGIPPLIDNLRKADDDNPKGYYEFEPVKKTKEDAGWVPQGLGRVVKMVHLLLLDLPLTHQYRVVFMRRHLDEVIKSQNVMLERKGKPTDNLPEERMKQIFQTQMKKVIDHMVAHPANFRFVEVDYNTIMREPQHDVSRLSEFFDGLDTARMLAVVDPALYRNRAVR